jgi:hypothetical protein
MNKRKKIIEKLQNRNAINNELMGLTPNEFILTI